MIARIVAVIACSGTLSLAAASWSTPTTPGTNSTDIDVGDTINTIVASKAGRSATRISAGLSGDWASAASETAVYPRAKVVFTPLSPSLAKEESNDPIFESPAAALPLPPAAIAFLPGVMVAWAAGRRFVRN